MSDTPSAMSSIPFMFEKNIGQHKNESKFVLRNSKNSIYFLESEIVLSIMKFKEDNKEKSFKYKFDTKENMSQREFEVNLLKMKLENSNKDPEIIGLNEFDCKINYFKGKDKTDWTTGIPVYEKLLYKEVYPGIDLVYYGNEGTLEYDFVVSPNGDFSKIKLNFEGADKVQLDEDGNLIVEINESTIKMLKPKVYQQVNDKKIDLENSFVVDGDNIRFDIPNYDKSKVLVIDPPLLYGSYLGGNNEDAGYKVAVDSKENAYITGWTYSTEEFPLQNPYQGTIKGYCDAFLIKIDTKASGSASLKYATYLGGNNSDYGYSVAVDGRENAYIVGETSSTEQFPSKNAYQVTGNENSNGFLIKLDTRATGDASLKYATYLGGNNYTVGYGVAVDTSENAYIAGYTGSTEQFPLKNAYQASLIGSTDAFLIKIKTRAIGSASLKYGTYLGGNKYTQGYGVAIDEKANAYITGYTSSTEQFPLRNPYQEVLNGYSDAFLIKLDTTISGDEGLRYGTYLGGNNNEEGYSVAVDLNENAYITGQTSSTEQFPLKNAYQETLNSYSNAFLIKIDTKEVRLEVSKANEKSPFKLSSQQFGPSSLKYGTYLGGSYSSLGYSVAVDSGENAYIVGCTAPSDDFPLKYAYQESIDGDYGAFLLKINTKLIKSESLKYGTYLGGNSSTYGGGVAVDEKTNAYITGETFSGQIPQLKSVSGGFPLKNAYQETLKGQSDGFLIKLNTLVCDLKLEKSTCKCNPCTGEKISYTLKITNNGPDESTNIVINDILPSGLKVESFICTTGTIGKLGDKLVWKIPKLEVNQIETAMIVVIIDKTILCQEGKKGEYVLNTVTLTCDNTIINPYNTIDTDIIYINCNCV